MPSPALPQELVPALRRGGFSGQDGFHSVVHGHGAQASAHDKHHGEVVPQSKMVEGFLVLTVVRLGKLDDVVSEGVAGDHKPLDGKPAFHAGHAGTHPTHAVGQKPVGHPRETVLFLDEGGQAQAHGLVQQGAAGKPTDAHHHLRSVAFQQASRLPKAAQEHEGEHEVAGAGQLPFHPGDPQAVDVVPGGGNLVHFHAPQGADKADVGLGVSSHDLIGNRQRRVDVAACAAS